MRDSGERLYVDKVQGDSRGDSGARQQSKMTEQNDESRQTSKTVEQECSMRWQGKSAWGCGRGVEIGGKGEAVE